MIILEHYDDLDWARDRTKTVASYHDVPLTWKNKTVTLDLSEDNYQQLSDMLDTVVKAGKVAEKTLNRPAGRGQAKKRKPGRRPAAYYEGLVAWVDARGITKRNGSGRPAYEGNGPGRRDYPDWLIAEYDEHLAKTSQAA